MRRSILGALIGGAPACWDGNPGFMLKDSETGSVGPTTHVTGVTVTSEGPTTTTTTSEATSTSVGPATSGSETSTSTTEALTGTESESSSTTGPLMPWDNDCDDKGIRTVEYPLVADTFLMVDPGQAGKECILEGMNVVAPCEDVTFGGEQSQEVFNIFTGGDDPAEFTRKVFVARFKSQPLMDNDKPVPPEAILSLTLAVHFERIGGGEGRKFALRRLSTTKEWMVETKVSAQRCTGGLASWRCMACSGKEPDVECAAMGKWDEGVPYTEAKAALADFVIAQENEPVSIGILGPAALQEDYALLNTLHPGYVIVPAKDTPPGEVKIHTVNGKKPPKLTIRYCRDPNGPDKD